MVKVEVDFNKMRSSELLTLARNAVRAHNDVSLDRYKVIKVD